MGLFKDLNFKKRNGEMVAPDSEKLGGYTLSEVKSQIKPTFVNIGGGTISKASITSANLPTTLHKDSSWTQYKPVAYNFVNKVSNTINTLDVFNDSTCIATYQFNNNTNDLSGNYNGTASNITYGTGIVDQCAVFNGTSSGVYIAYEALNPVNLIFSASLWVKGTSLKNTTSTNANIICSVNKIYYSCSVVSGSIYLTVKNSSGQDTSIVYNTSNLDITKWYNLTFVFTGLNKPFYLYLDGVEIGTNIAPTSIYAANAYNVCIGYARPSSPYQFFNGQIDQVRVFTKALSSVEVMSLYTETNTQSRKLIINNVEQSIISETLPVDTTNTHDIFGDGSCKATYQFNGNANDLSGTYNGTATSITYGTGKFGQCAVFNGTSSYISTGFNFNLNSQDFTISLFTKFTTTNESYILGHLWNASQTTSGLYERFYISSINGKINVCFSQIGALPNTEYLSSLSLLNDGNFHHVTLVYVSSNKKVFLYVDGILQGSKVYTIASNTKVFTPTFGKVFRTDGATQYQYFFNGSIDQVRIFNRVLTDYEIGILYKETKPAITTFGTVLTNEKDLQIKVEGNADIVELNFVEGV